MRFHKGTANVTKKESEKVFKPSPDPLSNAFMVFNSFFLKSQKVNPSSHTSSLTKGGHYSMDRHPVLDMQSLPFQQLHVLLTLFSESFASFPCGTCVLSVSHRVFRLRWSIPPDSGCTLKQPYSRTPNALTIQKGFSIPLYEAGPLREFHPLCCAFPGGLGAVRQST